MRIRRIPEHYSSDQSSVADIERNDWENQFNCLTVFISVQWSIDVAVIQWMWMTELLIWNLTQSHARKIRPIYACTSPSFVQNGFIFSAHFVSNHGLKIICLNIDRKTNRCDDNWWGHQWQMPLLNVRRRIFPIWLPFYAETCVVNRCENHVSCGYIELISNCAANMMFFVWIYICK